VFKLFKRPSTSTEQPVTSEPTPKRERRQFPREFSTAYEVIEGNDEADWLLWEESVSFQDSKIHRPQLSLVPARTSEITVNVQAEVTDAFDSVRKRTP
jgi:hypothetical protein